MPEADKYYAYIWWHFGIESKNNNENILTIEKLLPNTSYNINVVGVKWVWAFWTWVSIWSWVAWFWVKVLKTITTLAE